MKIYPKNEPRRFTIKGVTISHVADINLDPDEMITLRRDDGSEYDVAAKSWGYYATPSLNGRLRDQGFRSVLVKNKSTGQRYVLLVREGQQSAFNEYLAHQDMKVLGFLDEECVKIDDSDDMPE
ncbi:hypothetical protein [Aestuariispira insulae]|uniref:Uncharacterized protein n=1 Tax=Aestuariispira insulae TaxID=1461337 RepID=A0A3D9HSQ2_9PROT|nr:hypothetical protein [Aestuariispira insulae]RED52445.1 hypothetical protein DFP90_102466 [Aestuariispira insulae]